MLALTPKTAPLLGTVIVPFWMVVLPVKVLATAPASLRLEVLLFWTMPVTLLLDCGAELHVAAARARIGDAAAVIHARARQRDAAVLGTVVVEDQIARAAYAPGDRKQDSRENPVGGQRRAAAVDGRASVLFAR